MHSNQKINLKEYKDSISVKNKFLRLLWNLVYIFLFRPFPTFVFRKWRLFILKIFGAKIHKSSTVYASTKIWAPWNLEMDSYSLLGPHVDCYNVDKIIIGSNCVVSQKTYLCSASHNISIYNNPLITAPIIVKNQAWVAASVFIGMGVTVGEGAVIGARAAVFKDVEPWTIVGGNPAKFIKKREIQND